MYEVRYLLQGEVIGGLVDAHDTLEEAEAAHITDFHGIVLVAIPADDEALPSARSVARRASSRRSGDGLWTRAA